MLAKKLGLHKYGMDKNRCFGDGTLRAVNYLLGRWGYLQNRLEDEHKGKMGVIDRKFKRIIDEKKQSHGLKQE